MVAMLTRKINVRGIRHLGTFGKLFAEPRLDTVIEPDGAGAGAIGSALQARTASVCVEARRGMMGNVES
jgi:hypothetical protein